MAFARQLYKIEKGNNVCSENLKKNKREKMTKIQSCRSLTIPMFGGKEGKGRIDKRNKRWLKETHETIHSGGISRKEG